MKYIKSYNQYRSQEHEYLYEGWLGDKLKKLSAGMKAALQSFTKPFKDVIGKAKKEWAKGVQAEEIRQTLMKALDASFNGAMKAIDKIDNPEDVTKVYDDFTQAIIQLDDTLTKELDSIRESVINEASVQANVAGAKAVIDNILGSVKNRFEEAKQKYQEELAKSEELDSKRKEAKNYIKTIYNEVKTNIKKLNVDELMSQAEQKVESETGQADTREYKAGQKVTYEKKDGSENEGTISEDQEDVEEGFIKVFTEKNPKGFAISKANIKNISEEGEEGNVGNPAEDIKKKLGEVKNDKNKMKRISDLLKVVDDEEKMKEIEAVLAK